VQADPATFLLPFGAVAGDVTRLVARLRAGDVAALAEAYDAHHAEVRAFARRLVGDEHAAEDLVQETFLALPAAMRGFRGDASLTTFLLSICVNHARHFIRAAARQRAAMARLAQQPSAPLGGPERAAEGRELAGALVRALDELPLEQRVAVVLCEVEERTSADVAAIVGAPEATVRTRVFHAKRKLRELLAKRGIQ
jgi:RNA polymerase sigma-70 factor (ECF subfamily)